MFHGFFVPQNVAVPSAIGVQPQFLAFWALVHKKSNSEILD